MANYQVSTLKNFNSVITSANTQTYLAQVLGDKKNQFVNNLTALVANSEQLQKCDPVTVMYAGVKATALDLPLDQNLGFAYVIPFNNNRMGRVEAQFQLGAKGFQQLAMRTGQFVRMEVAPVLEGEIRGVNKFTGDYQFGEPTSEAVVGYMAYFRLTNGFEKYFYMSVEDINKHAKKYSKTYASNSGVWATNFDAMARKTVLKLLLSKFAPLSVEMQNAIVSDQAVIRPKDEGNLEQVEVSYVDNEPDTVVDTEAKSLTESQQAVVDAMSKQ